MSVSVERNLRKAKSHERRGETNEAIACYDLILDAFPANQRAQKALMRLKKASSEPPKAVLKQLHECDAQEQFQAVMEKVVPLLEAYPQSEPLWTYLGVAATRLGNLEVAKRAFSQSIEFKPDSAKAHANLGSVLDQLEDFASAAECFEVAFNLEPQNLSFRTSLGNMLSAAGQSEPAIAHLQAVLAKEPDDAFANCGLGTAYMMLGKVGLAISHLEKAAAADPACVKTLNNLSSAQFAAGLLDAAKASSEKAIALNPDHANAYTSLANVYQHWGALDEAVRHYASAVRLAPRLHSAYTQKLHFQAQMCDWTAYDEFPLVTDELGITGEAVASWALLGFEDDPRRQAIRSERYSRQWVNARIDFERPVSKPRLRIGYFSGDLYDHATLFLLIGVLEQHDNAAFEVVVYGYNKPRVSERLDRLTAAVDRFVDVHGQTDADIIARARADQLDIAIDLKGYTHGARPGLFFEGVAPVQINYLGYPGTLGSDAFDYIIADEVVIPEHLRCHYKEHVIYLPNSYQPNDDKRQIATMPLTRADCGLPEEAVVICCFNSCYKITPDEFDIWMRVLRENESAVLWLLDCNKWATENLRAAAKEQGVADERLIFAGKLPQDQHLARHRLADFFVDTFNVNAHTTASDALFVGLPVITLPGQQFAARVGASLCSAVGLAELVASDRQDYERLIMQLASDADARARVRSRLADNLKSTPLFDTAGYTRDLEAGYRTAWDAWQSGKPVDHIHVATDTQSLRKVS